MTNLSLWCLPSQQLVLPLGNDALHVQLLLYHGYCLTPRLNRAADVMVVLVAGAGAASGKRRAVCAAPAAGQWPPAGPRTGALLHLRGLCCRRGRLLQGGVGIWERLQGSVSPAAFGPATPGHSSVDRCMSACLRALPRTQDCRARTTGLVCSCSRGASAGPAKIPTRWRQRSLQQDN